MQEKGTKVILKGGDLRKVAQRADGRSKGNYHPVNFGSEGVEPGDNSRFLDHELKVMNLSPIDRGDDGQVKARIVEYFELCRDDDMKPTVSGLAASLGVDRRTLWQYKVGEVRVSSSDTIKKAYDLLERMWEDYMQSGKINPVSGIFLGKNNFAYTDKQEITLKNGTASNDPQEVEADYANERSAIEGEPDDVPEIDKKPN